MGISIEDCLAFLKKYIHKNFTKNEEHDYYIHKDGGMLWLLLQIKESNFMPSYYIFNEDNKLLLVTTSPFDAKKYIENYIRLLKIRKLSDV